MEKSNNRKAAEDDIFFSLAFFIGGVILCHINISESDWWGVFGSALMALFGGLWLTIRVYHIKNKIV